MRKSPLKIAFFGMPGSVFSSELFRSLTAMANAGSADLRIDWLVVPMRPEALPDPRIPLTMNDAGLLETARQEGVAIVSFADPDNTAFTGTWAADPPDLLVCGCFPFKIPSEIIQAAVFGGWNLHPSLLPAYRGPDPLFWQLRDGVAETGITLHQMSDSLDAGDILAQHRYPLAAGIHARQLSRQLAQLGGRLLGESLLNLVSGQLPARKQAPKDASYQPLPQVSDFILDDGWSAERAFRFIRGTTDYGMPYTLQTRYGDIVLKDVAGYVQEKTANESCITSDQLHIQMAGGTLNIPLSEVLNMEGLKLT